MLKDRIAALVQDALKKAGPEINIPEVTGEIAEQLRVERPRMAEHGDYAVNVSPLARYAKMAPPKIAEAVRGAISQNGLKAEVAAGFLNFRVTDTMMAESLIEVLEHKAPGRNETMADLTILLEYVSANPTGPLHIGHGRWAALGDSLVRIWRHCGATVTPEFYINDAGVQMQKIAFSIWLRAVELLRQKRELNGDKPLPDPPYPGEYVLDLADALLEEPGSAERLRKEYTAWLENDVEPDTEWIIPFARERVLGEQKDLLEKMGVHFEAWFSELELLEQRKQDDMNRVERILNKLEHDRFAYWEDNALWLQSSEFGDEKDRVLIKSDGSKTYLAGDIAYHDHKYSRVNDDGRPQYNRVINIWGADHHGYIARMRAALIALGHLKDEDDPRFEIVLGQLVNLIIEGEKTRMGKRRKMLTLQDVIDEVGVDATRFWMVSKSADTALDFDVDLAKSASQENPVYYAQYAHARCASILRNALEPSPNVSTGETQAPFVTREELDALGHVPTLTDINPLFDALENAQARDSLKALIFRLDSCPDTIEAAGRLRSPHLVARYVLDLAADFHSFYNVCRILTDEPKVTRARLALVLAIKKVIAQCLDLLGVSAPESM